MKRNRRIKRAWYPAKELTLPDNFKIVKDFDIDWDRLLEGAGPFLPDTLKRYGFDEPGYDCCRGCSNWKGTGTICNCILPTLEMQREGYGNFNDTITVIKLD